MDSSAATDYWLAVFSVATVHLGRRISPRFNIFQRRCGRASQLSLCHKMYQHLRTGHDADGTYIPDSLLFLNFTTFFDEVVPPLPPRLQVLRLSSYVNKPLPPLPDTLRTLHLGYFFNCPLPPLPDGLTTLHLGDEFNQPLNLPAGLTSLRIGGNYGRPLPALPGSLRYLRIDTHLLPPLPEGLEELVMANPLINGVKDYPTSLTSLIFTDVYPRLRLPPFPPSLGKLRTLVIGGESFEKMPALPVSITALRLDQVPRDPKFTFAKLTNLQHLTICSVVFTPLSVLPPNLVHLCIRYQRYLPLPELPPTMRTLVFWGLTSCPDIDLPQGVTMSCCA